MSRAARLRAWIEGADRRPVEWGRSDCSAWAAAWVSAERGVKVPLPAYQTAEEAHALIAMAGGLDRLWTGALAEIGVLAETLEPDVGDVGIIDTSRFGAVGVIFCAGGVAAWRAATGGVGWIRPRTETLVKAWAI